MIISSLDPCLLRAGLLSTTLYHNNNNNNNK